MEIIIIMVILSVIGFCFLRQSADKTEAYENMENIVREINSNGNPIKINFKYSDQTTGIAIDDVNAKIVMTINSEAKIYDYSELTGVDVEIDGNQTSSANMAGAAMGGILFGGAGAIVGAMTKNNAVKTIMLKLYFSDLHNPVYSIYFLNTVIQTNKIYPIVKDALQEVDEWYGRISSILKRNDQTQRITNDSVADEIVKLSRLKADGIISDDEFIAAKSRVIGT